MKYPKIYVPLLTIALFPVIIFSSYNIITGKIYSGASSDDSYIVFMMVIDLIPFLLFYRHVNFLLSNKRVRKILLILLLYLCILCLEGDLDNLFVKGFIAYSIPATLIGIMIARFHMGERFAKYLELVMLFLSLSSVFSVRALFSSVSRMDVGKDFGIGLTSLAYDAAFAFSLNLYFLLFGNELNERFSFTKSRLYKLLTILLFVLQFVTCLSSGGRGGAVLLIISTIVLCSIKVFKKNKTIILRKKRNRFRVFFLITMSFFFSIIFMPSSVKELVEAGASRSFSYISGDGIDMGETSNRDLAYADAINSFNNRPFSGYGLLMKGALKEEPYPHNIILELLLQGGIAYLFVFQIFMFFIIKKFIYLMKKNNYVYIIPVSLYPITMLCFSGSYLLTGLFWFSITYIVCCDTKSTPILRDVSRDKS